MTLLLHAFTKTIRLTAVATLLTALCLGKKFLLRWCWNFVSLHTLRWWRRKLLQIPRTPATWSKTLVFFEGSKNTFWSKKLVFFEGSKNTFWMSPFGFHNFWLLLCERMKFLLASMKKITNLLSACSGFLIAACVSKSCRLWSDFFSKSRQWMSHWKKMIYKGKGKPDLELVCVWKEASKNFI